MCYKDGNCGCVDCQDNDDELNCTKCRSQIEAETRQKCWEEVKDKLALTFHSELRKKWEIEGKWQKAIVPEPLKDVMTTDVECPDFISSEEFGT